MNRSPPWTTVSKSTIPPAERVFRWGVCFLLYFCDKTIGMFDMLKCSLTVARQQTDITYLTFAITLATISYWSTESEAEVTSSSLLNWAAAHFFFYRLWIQLLICGSKDHIFFQKLHSLTLDGQKPKILRTSSLHHRKHRYDWLYLPQLNHQT